MIGTDERTRIERHMPDCFGTPYSCQSCGCDRQGRFHGESRPCVGHAYLVAWAKHPPEDGVLRVSLGPSAPAEVESKWQRDRALALKNALEALIIACRGSTGNCRLCAARAGELHDEDCPVTAAVDVLEPDYAAVRRRP